MVVFWSLTLFSACFGSGNSALPQASLPIPSNDDQTGTNDGSNGVEITSPDSLGFVVITAKASTVPDTSTVVITVGSSTSGLLKWGEKAWTHACDLLIPEARASSACATDIPQCPDLNSSGKCQTTARSDGSFSVQVPAKSSNRITVSYLDSTSCAETVLIDEQQPNSNTIRLGLNAIAVDADSNFDMAYVFGGDADGQNRMLTVDFASRAVTESTVLNLGGLPQKFLLLEDAFDDNNFYLETSSGAMISPPTDNGDFDESALINIVDPDGNQLTGYSFLAAHTLYHDSSTGISCPSTSFFTSDELASGDTYFTRVFFASTEQSSQTLYYFDFVSLPNRIDLDFLASDSSGNTRIKLKEVNIDFPDLGPYRVASIDHIGPPDINSGEHTLLLSVLQGDSADRQTYLAKTDSFSSHDLCSGTLSFPATQRIDVSDFSENIILHDTPYLYDNDSDSYSGFLLILDLDSQKISGFDTTDFILDFTITFSADDSSYTYRDEDDGETDSGTYGFSDRITNFVPVYAQNDIDGIFLIGEDFSGSDFIGPDDSETEVSLEPESSQLRAIFPVQFLYDSPRNQVVILDRGLLGSLPDETTIEEDFFNFDADADSFLKFYELADTSLE